MKREDTELLAVVLTLPLAFALWYGTFALDQGNFWLKMSISTSLLGSISLLVMGPARKQLLAFQAGHLWLGIASAALLYVIFWVGRWFLTGLLSFASAEINSLYARREGTSLWLIAPLLLLVTGPFEELYWRGLLQRVLMRHIGPLTGLLLAAATYALVHLWTLNTSLVLAAFTAGLIWGWIYLGGRSLVPVMISHALWGVLIFVLLPLG